MGRFKYEEDLKKKLEQRSIQPSSEVWTKLLEQLDANKKHRKSSLFLRIGVAASIVAFVSLSITFLNKGKQSQTETVIVKSKNATTPTYNNEKGPLHLNAIREVASKNEKNNLKKPVITTTDQQGMNLVNHQISNKGQLKSEKNLVKVIPDTPKRTNNNEDTPAGNDLLSEKLETMANKKKSLETNTKTKKAVAYQEVDSLLQMAHSELLMEKQFKKSITVVNAEALLRDVEKELHLTLKSKIFKALKDNYNKGVALVANRKNNTTTN